MKAISLVMAFLMLITGCSSYKTVGYDIALAGNVVVTERNNAVLTEGDLLGKHLQVQVRNGAVLTGTVLEVTESTLVFRPDNNPDFDSEDFKSATVFVKKSNIVEVRTQHPDTFKSIAAVVGFTAVSTFVWFLISFRNFDWN